MENIKQIPLPDVFSKGFINDKADIKIPYQMAQSLQNLRLYNKVSAPRKGFATKINMWLATGIKWIWTYNNKICFTYNWHIYLTDTSIALTTDLGVLNTWTATQDFWPSITSFWDNLMIFNGWVPQLWNGTTLADITTIDSGYKPYIAEMFDNSQWISNWTASVIRSKPAISTFPGNTYIFDVTTECPIKTLTSPVVAIKSTIQALFTFCENEIHQFNNSYQSATTPPEPIFNKIYEWIGPWSNNSVTAANNTVFFLTKDNKIKTINYIPGIPNSQVWELSNLEDNSIQQYIDDNLHADQHLCTCERYDLDALVKFNVRSKSALHNDLVLIYDLKHKTWLLDTEKKFWTNGVSVAWKYYIWSNFTWKLYQDEVGKTDDTAAITFKRKLKLFDFWNPTIRKVLREMNISWTINLSTNIQLTCEVDWVVVKTEYLDKYLVSNDQFWIKTVDVPYAFRKVFSRWDLLEKGYTYTFEFIATGTNLDFTLEHLTVWVWAIWEWSQNELFEK